MKATRNGKQLVIVESPAKAKTISRFLNSSEYVVEASYGHVRDLPEKRSQLPEKYRREPWADLAVKVDEGYEPIYIILPDKKRYVKKLQEAAKKCSALVLATDEDREGESISWHVLQVLRPPKTMGIKRIVFHEVTEEAILQALKNPRDLDENLVRAQEARRILDRLYGYLLSPLLWKRIARGLSAGRVQSVAVRLLVQREQERREFVPAGYWDIKATLQAEKDQFNTRLTRVGEQRIADGKSFNPKTGQLSDESRLWLKEQDALDLAERLAKARPWRVTSLEEKPGKEYPSPPFTTSTLQQEANRKLRLSAQTTMLIAQQLYEGVDLNGERVGLITYMRTDSVTLSEKALTQCREVIRQMYGDNFLPPQPIRYKTKARGAQEAHEAIRPTDIGRTPESVKPYLTEDQYRLYELIWKRTVASQMVPAEVLRKSVEVTVEEGETPYTFSVSGKRILFPGFLRAYVEGSDDPEAELADQETLLPPLSVGQELEPLEVTAEGHETKPPRRYTEASLVKRLEEEGIGRPSTYASIISTIQERGYIFKQGNELVPTFTAFCVTRFLEEHFPDLVDLQFTAKMESALDLIAEGKEDKVSLIDAFYRGSKEREGLVRRIQDVRPHYPVIPIGEDPQTGKPLVVRIGRFGPYLQRGEGGPGNVSSIPDTLPPDELTVEKALELLEQKNTPDLLMGTMEDGSEIWLRAGQYGQYLELRKKNLSEEAETKPNKGKKGKRTDPSVLKRVSLPRGLQAEELTPKLAQQLLALPRELGKDPESGEAIFSTIGRFGPYIKRGGETRRLSSWREALEITLPQALDLLKTPKATRGSYRRRNRVVKEFPSENAVNGVIRVIRGKYGPYVTDGTVNAKLPPEWNPEEVTVEQARQLLEAKRSA